jgi:hypothetical protein
MATRSKQDGYGSVNSSDTQRESCDSVSYLGVIELFAVPGVSVSLYSWCISAVAPSIQAQFVFCNLSYN